MLSTVSGDTAFTSTCFDHVCRPDTISTSWWHERSTCADGSPDEL